MHIPEQQEYKVWNALSTLEYVEGAMQGHLLLGGDAEKFQQILALVKMSSQDLKSLLEEASKKKAPE